MKDWHMSLEHPQQLPIGGFADDCKVESLGAGT
jgi:hypothetical protein